MKREKIVFIGDIHGRNTWKQIVEKEKDATHFIFIGDYWDSFDIPIVEQKNNFKEIIDFKRNSKHEVILLIGNHDFHYMDVGETYSGYQHKSRWDISTLLKENIECLQMSYKINNILCTHAGVSSVFMDNIFGENGWDIDNIVPLLNERFTFQPKTFCFNGYDPYGNNITQSPIWIRQQALCLSNKNRDIKKELIQIIGHTQVNEINLEEQNKYLGGKYYMIDSLHSGYYLVYEKETFIVKNLTL